MWATSSATTDTAPPVVARVRELNPGWFASVMGTAILAVATYNNPAAVESVLPAAHLLGTCSPFSRMRWPRYCWRPT